MPNTTLIHQLETQLGLYTQQQKAANALQTNLKNLLTGQQKAIKALGDYALVGTVTIEEAHTTLTQTRLKDSVADPLLNPLKREVKALAGWISALREAITALQAEPADVVRLDKAITHLQDNPNPALEALLPELLQEFDIAQRNLGDVFSQTLRDALAQQGLTIRGRAPKFELGRFELDTNFAKRYAVLRYGRDVVTPKVGLTVEATLKAYQSVSKLITGRNVDGSAWMNQLYLAYQTVRKKRDAQTPRVSLVECYLELTLLMQSRAFQAEPSKATFKDYTRAQFGYDFYELAQRQHLTSNGYSVKAHTATKSQTDSPAKSFWIVEGDTPYDGRYIADIEFVKA